MWTAEGAGRTGMGKVRISGSCRGGVAARPGAGVDTGDSGGFRGAFGIGGHVGQPGGDGNSPLMDGADFGSRRRPNFPERKQARSAPPSTA